MKHECQNCNCEELYTLRNKAAQLEAAIKKHREQTGHNMCWENDEELWSALNDSVKIDHTAPNWCEFMTKCAEYRASKDKKADDTKTGVFATKEELINIKLLYENGPYFCQGMLEPIGWEESTNNIAQWYHGLPKLNKPYTIDFTTGEFLKSK